MYRTKSAKRGQTYVTPVPPVDETLNRPLRRLPW
jgi:hypothetical protein